MNTSGRGTADGTGRVTLKVSDTQQASSQFRQERIRDASLFYLSIRAPCRYAKYLSCINTGRDGLPGWL